MLNILSGYKLKGMTEEERIHFLAETMRRAFRDRALYLGDPEFTDPPLDLLSSKTYARSLRASIDLKSATPSRDLVKDFRVEPAPNKDQESKTLGGGQTTHFCVADGEGCVVSNTYTLEDTFGSKAVVGKTGILLNNEMRDFNPRPGWTCEDGTIGTEPNLIAPGKRMLSSMCPVILLRTKQPVAAFGSPGGRSIINTVLQVLVNLVDLDLPLEEAVKAPRIHHQWFPDLLYVEKSMPLPVRQALEARGHTLKEKDFLGDCHALLFKPITGEMQGVADQRIDGCAAGL
jgi:gamma-glutamyltranspeptidase/glutathione hydrolase